MSIPCGSSKPHPSHNFMFARTRRRCPGIDAPVAPDSDGSDLLPLGACVTRAGSGKCLHPPAFHHCIICACDGYDATPPFVAAPPVPPVVPDAGDALDFEDDGHDSVCELEDDRDVCFCSARRANARGPVVPDSDDEVQPLTAGALAVQHHALNATAPRVDHEASGSGVVPDKPALAPEPHYCCDAPIHPHWGSVDPPAVTDDEAATEVAARTLAHNDPGLMAAARSNASRVVADLRSAGFLIVHHTKET